jgi:tetratricopeptide (TPR) repeat protein
MSLLLEALKKAEKAKEEAQRRARGEPEPAPAAAAPAASAPAPKPPVELALQEDAPSAEEPRRITTRAELPDISAPMEIASEDLPAKAAPRPREELRMEGARETPPPRRTPGAASAAQSSGAAPQAAERAAARKVFEAKFREPNPKLPFYITLGVLGVCAVGIVVYFWYQLRPPSPLVNTNPPRPAEAQVAVAPQAPAPSPSAPATATAIPGLPGSPPAAAAPRASASAQPATRQPSATPAIPVERPVLAPAPRLAAPSVNAPRAPAPPPGPEVNVSRAAPQVHPKVDAGYAAYQAGDLAKARAEYEQTLADEPSNRDALLGMAAIETRSARYESAESYYQRLLQSDPRDAHAQAGLLALRSARLDPLSAESRVKSMLAQDPGSHVLNFTLGNQLAQQGRWAEAQQEYFKAFSGDPENADFAYNLAVSLDHLRQRRLAREYYLRAVSLAEKRGATFDPATVRARAAQLGN